MRVLIVNTSENAGGAAVAASRLVDALNNNGVKARMMVRDKLTDSLTVASAGGRLQNKWNFLWERWCVFCHLGFSRKNLFAVDIANAGTDITRTREFKEADIIHLHWVNQGMLSLRGIGKILNSGKPVVWTMHDMWPATAVCHLTFGCRKYTAECSQCPLLPSVSVFGDVARRVWRRKQRILNRQGALSFVACSKWLAAEARRSKLLEGVKVTAVPNPIDVRTFCPGDKVEARRRLGLPLEGRLILFVAQNVSHVNKGMGYLAEACRMLAAGRKEAGERLGVVMLGGCGVELAGSFDVPAYPLGYVTDVEKIVNAYRAADLFVLPSLSENLPNTIMEAMACGVPCVGFNVGGIPEMIDHRKNGYVAAYKSAEDLADGMRWILQEADYDALSRAAVAKVSTSYSQQSVALKYIEVYNQAIAYRHYRL